MMDLAAWLRNLGLDRYEAAFRENDIDFTLLRDLSDQDLEKIGVASLGHRRKLLRAIADLESSKKESPALASAPIAALLAPETAERRQVTVMFSDLVGSTALSTRMDPEDLREVISSYHKCVAQIVRRFDGFVAQYLGDGALVYFGYPEAHEDDAERAVRAGLELTAAVGGLTTRAPLQTRVGIATGLVVVGDLTGSGASQEVGIIGETPNLAARLQGIAEPNMIVIAESTRRLLGNLCELQDLGSRDLKGIAGQVWAWAALRMSSVESRFEALHTTGLTALVGREEESEILLRRWFRAKTGEGQVVLLSGEAGIGKSRLMATLMERLASESHTRLGYFCSPQHTDSALYPIIGQMERAAGFARDDTVEARFGKLQALLAPGSQNDDDIALLTELLSLPSSAADLNLSPQRKREKLFEALLSQLEAEARRRPVLMIFEDAHYIDPTSRELLDLAVDRVRRLPVLLAITFRPEFRPPWGGRSYVTSLVLNPLSERDGVALAQNVAGKLTADIVAKIVERTDGVPLFIEELAKAVLESTGRGDRVAEVLATPSPQALAVPATLHASLMARLDRLGPAPKEVAQIGAVLGREFAYELIERVAQRDENQLQAALGQLSNAGLLFCRGTAPHASYLFKHALVQDAAYGTLLRGRRQEVHARVAAVLEQHFADLVERQPELLAHHLTAAGNIERAADQWLKAGQHAAARLTHLEAIHHFERGLAAMGALAEGPARDGREIELQLARGLSLFTAEGYSSAGAAEAYARARELAERRGEPHQLFMAVYGLWQSANGAGMILDCRRLSNRLQQLTARDADEELRLQAHHSAWATCLFAGEPAAAREHCEAGRQLYDPQRHRPHRLLYGGHDPGVCAGYLGAQVYWLLGYPDKALAMGDEALALAERIAHPLSLEDALLQNAILHLDRGASELALQRLKTAEALVAEQRLGFVVEPRFLRGAALSAQGAFEEAVACLRDGLASRLGAMRFRLYGLVQLADALARQGRHEAAIDAAEEGLSTEEKTGHRQWEAELHRIEGIALSGLNQIKEGQSALEEAVRVARRQQAKSYELRAATSLARLWGEQGRWAEARDLLAPVYGWFTEGFDTLDLKEAKTLLDTLAA
ncbi:MAG TPA: adenylate/guanylate cyclase domain-containing protein [Stellaceae bacterium]|nr:adenylate/guanylate cyclase domain-containing protein [Stellaceae bacterium]